MQQLGHDEVGDLVVDRRPQEDDALVEQAASRCRRRARLATSARRPSGLGGSWSSFFSQVGRVPARLTLATGLSPSAGCRRPRDRLEQDCPEVQAPRRAAPSAPAPCRPASRACSRASARSGEIGVAVLGQQVDGGALGEVLAQLVQAARSSRAARAASRAWCARCTAVACSASRTSPSAGSIVLGLDDRGDDGLAAQRLLGVGLGLREELLLASCRTICR